MGAGIVGAETDGGGIGGGAPCPTGGGICVVLGDWGRVVRAGFSGSIGGGICTASSGRRDCAKTPKRDVSANAAPACSHASNTSASQDAMSS
jgi:hypothetical protein